MSPPKLRTPPTSTKRATGSPGPPHTGRLRYGPVRHSGARARRAPRFTGHLALLLITFLWGSTFVLVKESVAAFPAMDYLALRFGLALAALLPYAGYLWVFRGVRFRRRDVWAGGATGLLYFVGYALQTLGLQWTSPARSAFITGLSVVIVPIVSALLFRQRLGRSAVTGVVLATAGLGLISFDAASPFGIGDLLTLGCAFGFAGHILAVDRFGREMHGAVLSTVQIAMVTGLSLLVSFVTRGQAEQTMWDGHISPAVWASAAFTGVVVTALLLLLQVWAQRLTTPTETALIFTMEPVFAALFGYVAIGERLTGQALVGCALILLGTLVAVSLRRDRHETPTVASEPAGIGPT